MTKARRTQPQIPSDFPKLPEGWIYIGHKDQTKPIGKFLICQYATFLAGTTWTIHSNILPNTNVYLAAPIDSDLHKAQLWHPINYKEPTPKTTVKKTSDTVVAHTPVPSTLADEVRKIREMIANVEKLAQKTMHNGHYLTSRSAKIIKQLCWETNGISAAATDKPQYQDAVKNVTDELRANGFDVRVGKELFVNVPN